MKPARLFVEKFGPPQDAVAPTLVFLHGIAGSTASWGAPFRALAGSHRVLLVDLLGFGRSPKPAVDYSLHDHLDALDHTLTSLGVVRPVIVGHSMGALLALAYAAHRPQAVQRLLLLALPWYASAAEARERIARQSLFNRWLAMETPWAHAACTLMCHARPWLMPLMPRLLRDVPPEVARDVLRHNWLSYSRSLRHLVIESNPAAGLARLQAPTLLVQGEQDETAPVEPVALGITACPQARLETIAAGHHMIFTHAQELADRVQRFAESIPA